MWLKKYDLQEKNHNHLEKKKKKDSKQYKRFERVKKKNLHRKRILKQQMHLGY